MQFPFHDQAWRAAMPMKLLAGLGNPGTEYEKTRHNAGFMCLDLMATKCGAKFEFVSRLQADLAKIRSNELRAFNLPELKGADFDLMLAKPMTYMNLSGQAIAAVMRFFKLDKTELLVIHDEVALPLGQIRFARAGGSAGHHGIESIMQSLACKDFQRLRIGVGPDPGGATRAHFLTSRMRDSELDSLGKTLAVSAEAAQFWLAHDIQECMNAFNGIEIQV